MLNAEQVREALRPVVDPELGMSVVDLGMIREVKVEGDIVRIKMVLTTPLCPLADVITGRVQEAAASVEGAREAKVTLLEEPWDPAWAQQG